MGAWFAIYYVGTYYMTTAQEIVYDKDADIFYNDKYMDVLKEKDYVLELKAIPTVDVKYDIVERDANPERKKPTVVDDINKFIGHGQVVTYAIFKREFSITKYMKQNPSDDDMQLSVSYILQKHCRTKLHKKNILVIHDAVFSQNRFFEHDGTLIDILSQYFLEHATKCNIYSIFPHPLSKKYKYDVTNDTNGNKYYMVNHDNSGNVVDYSVFSKMCDRLANTVFDVVYFRAYNINAVFNVTLAYFHIIMQHIDKNTLILFYNNITHIHNDHGKIIHIMRQVFEKVTLIKDKFLGVSYPTLYSVFTGFVPDNRISSPLKNMVDSRNIFEKNIKIPNKVIMEEYEVNYIDVILNKMRDRAKMLSVLAHYYEPMYNSLRKMIKNRINARQRALASKRKFAKYIRDSTIVSNIT